MTDNKKQHILNLRDGKTTVCEECLHEFRWVYSDGLCSTCHDNLKLYVDRYYDNLFGYELVGGTGIARGTSFEPDAHFFLYPNGIPKIVQYFMNRNDYFVPISSWDVIVLGKGEQHCIGGSYAYTIRSGTCHIICPLDKDGSIAGTVDIRPPNMNIRECKTTFNRMAEKVYRRARADIDEYMRLEEDKDWKRDKSKDSSTGSSLDVHGQERKSHSWWY